MNLEREKGKKMRIKNINPKLGDPVVFESDKISDCLYQFASAIYDCGESINLGLTVDAWMYRLREGIDFEIEYTEPKQIGF